MTCAGSLARLLFVVSTLCDRDKPLPLHVESGNHRRQSSNAVYWGNFGHLSDAENCDVTQVMIVQKSRVSL